MSARRKLSVPSRTGANGSQCRTGCLARGPRLMLTPLEVAALADPRHHTPGPGSRWRNSRNRFLSPRSTNSSANSKKRKTDRFQEVAQHGQGLILISTKLGDYLARFTATSRQEGVAIIMGQGFLQSTTHGFQDQAFCCFCSGYGWGAGIHYRGARKKGDILKCTSRWSSWITRSRSLWVAFLASGNDAIRTNSTNSF